MLLLTESMDSSSWAVASAVTVSGSMLNSRNTMRRALDELVIEGIQTTLPLHRRIMRNPDFLEGRIDTTWVERILLPPKAEASA